jgi:tetratricopeptide (TPR) repeat protein
MQCLHINPNHSLALNNMAAVMCKKGKFGKAQEYCERAITINPNDAMAHRNIAKILDTLGNTRDAVNHNRIAIQLGPGIRGVTEHADTMTYRNLARQLVARGQTESGHANAHYDAYRALAFKQNILANSEKTRELLIRTKTKI